MLLALASMVAACANDENLKISRAKRSAGKSETQQQLNKIKIQSKSPRFTIISEEDLDALTSKESAFPLPGKSLDPNLDKGTYKLAKALVTMEFIPEDSETSETIVSARNINLDNLNSFKIDHRFSTKAIDSYKDDFELEKTLPVMAQLEVLEKDKIKIDSDTPFLQATTRFFVQDKSCVKDITDGSSSLCSSIEVSEAEAVDKPEEHLVAETILNDEPALMLSYSQFYDSENKIQIVIKQVDENSIRLEVLDEDAKSEIKTRLFLTYSKKALEPERISENSVDQNGQSEKVKSKEKRRSRPKRRPKR